MRIGILGGAFDPIHNGHLALANAVLQKLSLELVIFVPSGISPVQKEGKTLTPAKLRLEMVKSAIQGNSEFEVSDVEIQRKGVSYSVDTLIEFRKRFPIPNELFWLVGADWAPFLNQWKDIETIFTLCQMVAVMRPGFQLNKLPSQVVAVEFDALNISSSEIRAAVKQGKNIDCLVPGSVCEIIKRENLYQ